MKITTNGIEIEFSSNETDDAISFLNKLQADQKKNKVLQGVVKQDLIDHSIELPGYLYELWTFLCDHDSESGVPVAGIARGMDRNPTTVSNQCRSLQERGYATRIVRGYYKARIP